MSNDVTLRDLAALSALTGLTVNIDEYKQSIVGIAEMAYEFADAFIAAREVFKDSIDMYRDIYNKQRENNRAAHERYTERQKAYNILYNYVVKKNLSICHVNTFLDTYKYHEGEDITEKFKVWEAERVNEHESLVDLFNKLQTEKVAGKLYKAARD
ncbi:MAG: hypothetical protein FWC21_04675 [Treponema sp.]|nr:hypothetical protein [Treponema sp.]